MRQATFSPGFRLSAVDVAVLVAGGVGAVAVGRVDRWGGATVAFVVGHFFLFCNVLRMSRRSELTWAAAFVTLAVVAVGPRWLPWPAVFAASAVVTVIVAGVELRRPSYHGVGWRWANPRLPDWWGRRTGG